MSDIPIHITHLGACTAEWENTLQRWSDQNSGSGNIEGLGQMRGLLYEAFSSLPHERIESPRLLGTEARALLVTQRSHAPVSVLLCGHYDTVYDVQHPFQRSVVEGPDKLRGPGVADMKGGIAVLLAALRVFEKTPQASSLGWQVLLTPDEETGSQGSHDLILATARKHHFGLVFEPARGNGDLVRSRSGTAVYTVTCHGRAAHAARVPNDGRNAILALAEYLLRINALPEHFPGSLVNVGNVSGGGVVNIVPDLAKAQINVRASQARTAAQLDEAMKATAEEFNRREGIRMQVEGGFDRMPKECGPAEELLFAAWLGAAKDLGVKVPGWQHSGGGSDGNLLSEAGLPNLDGVGIVGDHLHSEREYCEPSSIVERAQIAALVLHRIASGALSLPAGLFHGPQSPAVPESQHAL